MAQFVTNRLARMVAGSFFDLQTQDHQNKPLPAEKQHWFVALAFPKTRANWWEEQDTIFQEAFREAQIGYPNGEFQSPSFAWKIEDGDGKNKDRTGYAGHWIVKFTRNQSIGPVSVSNSNFQRIIDPRVAYRGNWYLVSGSCKANGCSGNQAGIYMNMDAIVLGAIGDEIVTGPSAESLFAGVMQGLSLPAGARAVGSAATPNAAMPTPNAAMPTPNAAMPTPNAAMPTPNAAMPTPNAAMPTPNAPVWVPQSAQAKANPDAAAWMASGWTEDQLIQQGHFVKSSPAFLSV